MDDVRHAAEERAARLSAKRMPLSVSSTLRTAETYTRFPPLPKYRRANVFCVSQHIAVYPPMTLTRSFPSISRYSSI